MSVFTVQDPDYAARVRDSFHRQGLMKLLSIRIERIAPGEVELGLDARAELSQQHGFLHGGAIASALDSACGYAASTLMPADAGVLSVEFKINFIAAGRGDRFRFVGRVRRHGRTLSFTEGEAIARVDGREVPVATMQATMMCVTDRAGVRG